MFVDFPGDVLNDGLKRKVFEKMFPVPCVKNKGGRIHFRLEIEDA